MTGRLILAGALLALSACASVPGTRPTTGPASAPATVPATGELVPSPSPQASGQPSADPSAEPTPLRVVEVTSPAQAAAVVFALNPMFAGVLPLQPDLIGQAAWYEASRATDGFSVVVTMGSGDCMAGCINRRTWTYLVARDGSVQLISEVGDEVEISHGEGSGTPARIDVRLIAGPVCPVEQDPPDPACAPRPVVNAEAVLRDPTGAEVARGVSGAEGLVSFSVPEGAYYVEAEPVEGLLNKAEGAAVFARGGAISNLSIAFDTGIR